MLTNFTSMITTIRKETEKLRDNLINNVPSSPNHPTNINLSSLFQNTITKIGQNTAKFGQNQNSSDDDNQNHDAARRALLFQNKFDLTVDTRKVRPSVINIRENFIYDAKFPTNFEQKININNAKNSNKNNTAKTTTTASRNKNSSSSSPLQNKNRNDRFTNFQIKTLNNLQDQNSDLSLAEELFMAEILREREEEEQRTNNRRTPSDRDEIRRRLAGGELFDLSGRKSNPGRRLSQAGINGTGNANLQVCFMNETASDDEDHNLQQQPQSLPCFDLRKTSTASTTSSSSHSFRPAPPRFLKPSPLFWGEEDQDEDDVDDFFSKQAKLQVEARQSLVHAKELAKLQLTQERTLRSKSPVQIMVAESLGKTGAPLLPTPLPHRVTKSVLSGLNLAQLALVVNDFHSHIEKLNEDLVSMLVERDDLNMEQDSMLVDIEDLSRYLAAKHNSSPHQSLPVLSASQSILGKKK